MRLEVATSYVCPACERSSFQALSPVFRYEPRRWFLWLGPRKLRVGDIVRCVNPACGVVSLAGLGGVSRLQAPQPPPTAAPSPEGAEDGKPPRRAVSQIHDSDLRWR